MSTQFQGAIFDVDGVLVDSPHEKAWRESLRELMESDWAAFRDQTTWSPEAFTSAVPAAQSGWTTCAADRRLDAGVIRRGPRGRLRELRATRAEPARDHLVHARWLHVRRISQAGPAELRLRGLVCRHGRGLDQRSLVLHRLHRPFHVDEESGRSRIRCSSRCSELHRPDAASGGRNRRRHPAPRDRLTDPILRQDRELAPDLETRRAQRNVGRRGRPKRRPATRPQESASGGSRSVARSFR